MSEIINSDGSRNWQANILNDQIKRLEQENEQLHKELQYKYEEMDSKGFILMGENLEYWKKLKSENQRLVKEQRILLCQLIINDEAETTVQITKEQFDNYIKQRTALEEIREIAKFHQYFNPELLEMKGDIGQIQDLKMTEIYEKINEVLG